MAAVTLKNTIKLAGTQTKSYGIGRSVDLVEGFDIKSLFELTGVAANQCNLFHCKQYTFVASTPQTLNLKSLEDLSGVAGAVVFARVRLLAIRFDGIVDGSSLEAGAEGSANEWLGYLKPAGASEIILPGTAANHGFVVRGAPNTTGWPVGTTNRLWKLLPSAHAFTASILIAGADA